MLAGGHLYYRCISTRPKAEGPATCHARNIRADRLEGVVWEMVSEAIRHPEILSQEVQRHAETGDGNLGERMTRLHSEIVDLKNQQRRLIEQRQKDVIDQEILERLSALEDQQKSKDAVVHAEERIAEYCRRLAEGLDNLDQAGKRATFAAFGVKVEATREDLSVVLEIDPGVTIIYPSSAPSVNYRYTVVMKPKPGEWPPPIVSAIPRMDPETIKRRRSRRLQEIRQQAKEHGLCTKCRREPAIPNKARCEECCKKNREYLTAKKQRPDRPGMP